MELSWARGLRPAGNGAAALGHGGRDNGAPGLRPHYGPHNYAAFVIDRDGYEIEADISDPA